ncbi:DNA cytosine methyltransferase, partial [Bacteroides fragilis]|nr:DNA cytosine methyltransferase [Bacteroides fragilis]
MKQSELTHGSLFSGIGGFELGAEMAGIDTLWNCEIEKFQGEILKT